MTTTLNDVVLKVLLMKKRKYLLVGMLILLSLFYWFQFRPYLAKKECNQMARKGLSLQIPYEYEVYSHKYTSCMRSKGL